LESLLAGERIHQAVGERGVGGIVARVVDGKDGDMFFSAGVPGRGDLFSQRWGKK
jgi:hypothetical protein